MTTNPNEVNLLPCPFCGSNDISKSMGKTGDGKPWHYIECSNCASCAEVEFWNTRTSATSDAAMLQDAKDSDMLEWLLHNLSGKALRDINVIPDSGGLEFGRKAIRAAIASQRGTA